MQTMFKIRTENQRVRSVNATIALDLRSTVRGLRELTHNIVEVAHGESAAPLETLVNYYASEKAKLDACLAIARAITFGVSIKLDENSGRYKVTRADKYGLNRHYATVERAVAGGDAGLCNNTLHDAIKSNRPPKSKAEFDPAKRASAFVKAGVEAGLSPDALRKAFDAALKDAFTDAKPAKPIMDGKPSHPATGGVKRETVRLFNRETGKFEEPRKAA